MAGGIHLTLNQLSSLCLLLAVHCYRCSYLLQGKNIKVVNSCMEKLNTNVIYSCRVYGQPETEHMMDPAKYPAHQCVFGVS